jgi:alpha-L-fucosidase
MTNLRLITATLVLAGATMLYAQQTVLTTPYDTTWASLKSYTVPEWYQDAKFGIYHHWGLMSVPAYGNEWYGRRMYDEFNIGPGGSFYLWHCATFGSPDTFGHKNFAPLFHAENFNPDAYIDQIIKSGAKYFAHMTSHHEGFLMYGTSLTPWNCVTKGPQKDVGRMLMASARKRGIHFGISNHLAENDWFYQLNFRNKFDAVQDSADTVIKYLYNLHAADDSDIYHTAPSVWWLQRWYALSREMIDVFQPDYVYYDNGWGMYPTFEPYRRYLGAYQYNSSIALGRGKYGAPGAVLIYKGGGGNDSQFVNGGAVYDFEGGVPSGIQAMTFQTDLKIGDSSWAYLTTEHYKGTKYLIAYLLDVVSKNGNLMLDIPPKPDGTLPDTVTTMLNEIGTWLQLNGEGVYATRVANIYGAGTLRFTRNQANNVIYVFDTVWPGNGAQLSVANYNSANLAKASIAKITLLGSGGAALAWSQSATALSITMPTAIPAACKYAYCFKIYCDAASTTPAAPSYLQAMVSYPTANAVNLTWTDNSSKATGYYVERSKNDTAFTRIATLPSASVTAYSDSMATPAAYFYRVQAYNTAGVSPYSDTASPAGLLPPTAVAIPEALASDRDFPNSLRSITTVDGGNAIRFISARDAQTTFVLYSLTGSVIAQKSITAKQGMNTLAWDKLGRDAPAIYFMEMKVDGESRGVVRMVKAAR